MLTLTQRFFLGVTLGACFVGLGAMVIVNAPACTTTQASPFLFK
jgi:hypothetical protein